SNSLVFNGGIEFRRLYKDLYPAATKWKKIGIELGCPPEQLDLIERKPSNRDDSDYLRDMLHYRQRRTEPSELTWEVIYRALLSSIVGESKLAKRIAQDHCPYLLESRGADLHIGQEAADNVFAMTGVNIKVLSASLVGAVVALASVLFVLLIPYSTHTTNGIVPLHRYWKLEKTDHFYTINDNEIGTIEYGQIGKHGYVYEGIQCQIYEEEVEHSVPLYRYWKSANSDHFYTTNPKEIGTVTPGEIGNHGSEGIVGYCFPTEKEGTVPLYRYWNPKIVDHFYTTNGIEIGTVTPGETGKGYISEGVVCYVDP
ncbi:hypothetical protein GBAR_LOCUS12817, partial [Geodia barretti]